MSSAVLTLSVLLLAALAVEPEYELAPGEELVTEGPGYRVKLELETVEGYNGSFVIHAEKDKRRRRGPLPRARAWRTL